MVQFEKFGKVSPKNCGLNLNLSSISPKPLTKLFSPKSSINRVL